MNISKSFSSTLTAVIAVAFLLISGCGGGGGGGGAPAEPVGDVSGDWLVESVVNRSACGGDSAERDPDEILSVTQSGSTITVTEEDSTVNTGTLSGNQLSWSGSYFEDGGNVSVSFSLTVAADCNSLSGTAPWTWTGSFTCSGTTQVNGTRLDPVGCGGGGGGGGTTISEVEPNDTAATAQAITVPVTISGNTIGDELTVGGTISNNYDAFSFTLTSTQTVTAILTGGITTDMDLYFLTADGLTDIAVSESFDSNESLTWDFTAGTYLVVVAPWDVPVTTSYTLSIQ